MPGKNNEPKVVSLLLVEDDDVDALGVKRALKQRRISNPLIRACDGVEGLELLRSGKVTMPYLVLLDLNMPRMGGLEFLQVLRSDAAFKKSVVFVLTTSKSDEDMMAAYDLNVAGYIVKSELTGSFDRLVDMLNGYWQIVELPHKAT
jgi:CheY-like chemotaxis protein